MLKRSTTYLVPDSTRHGWAKKLVRQFSRQVPDTIAEDPVAKALIQNEENDAEREVSEDSLPIRWQSLFIGETGEAAST
jgi:hypothetical protein